MWQFFAWFFNPIARNQQPLAVFIRIQNNRRATDSAVFSYQLSYRLSYQRVFGAAGGNGCRETV